MLEAVPRTRARRPAAGRLAEYEAKRDFAVTPEPAPGRTAPSAGPPSFMVHKHHARRLHYDLRLEMDGALASWAIPKGPSYDPGVRRLAVQTEDHPLEYGTFEGRIPEGAYGAGDSLIWDRGTYETVPPGEASRQRQKGHVHVELRGEKLRGRWHLVRTGRPGDGRAQWLLFKARDETADPAYDVVAERPESVRSGRAAARGPESRAVLEAPRPAPERLLERVFPPMLASPGGQPPRDEADWVFELKYDGFRALAGLSAGRVALWSRNRRDLAGRFPSVAAALARLRVGDAVLDGEVVALDARGAPRFQRLQRESAPDAVLVAFDLLWLDGEDLRARALGERRDLLESLLANAPPALRLAERLPGPVQAAFARAASRGFEGVIAKRQGSRYEGLRSRAWLKLKAVRSQEVAVIGFTRSQSQRDEIGALLVAVADGEGFRYAGKVGTGFTARQRAALERELGRDALPAPPASEVPTMKDATWVAPRRVAQVQFTEWTSDGRLRHPSFLGLRDDKAPHECVREEPVDPPAAGGDGSGPTLGAGPATAPRTANGGPTPVALTHPERLLYPRDRITKQELADYYARVAPALLRVLADRPLALEHWNDGIDRSAWFQQNLGRDAPAWLRVAEVPTRGGQPRGRRLIADRPEALRWLAQRSVLTLHMWSARVPTLESPDWVVFDLDPAEGGGTVQAVDVALVLRNFFERLALPSVPKTSGKRGLHVLVPIAPGHTHAQAAAFAAWVSGRVAELMPEVTVERTPARRRGRLYLDALQNGYGKTIVAAYSPRGLDGAPVSAPLAWGEVTRRLDPARFTLRTMPRRLDRLGDLFEPALRGGARLPSID
jgi:bifunctional non-homologous end joining protein LigD